MGVTGGYPSSDRPASDLAPPPRGPAPGARQRRPNPVRDRVNLLLHQALGVEEPCDTGCTHVVEGEWTALGVANVIGRQARPSPPGVIDGVHIEMSCPPPRVVYVPVPDPRGGGMRA